MVRLGGFLQKFCAVAVAAASLTACEDANSPLQGRYLGFLTRRGALTRQLVAQSPDLKGLESGRAVTIQVFPTLASTPPIEYRLSAQDRKTFSFRSLETGGDSVALTRSGDCASGTWTDYQVSLCWQKDHLKLLIQNPREEFLRLELARSDDLPRSDDTREGRAYSLDELLGRAKFLNYTVSQEAERLYQAKQNVGVARGNLLPSLNLKAVVGFFTGDYLAVAGRLLPFLFPGNWFRWEASKDLHRAERASFASLRGNEMNTLEGLYYVVLRDQLVLESLKAHLAWMLNTQQNLRKEEQAGTLPTGSAEFFGNTLQQLDRDRIGLERLLVNNYSEIAQAVALPPIGSISSLNSVEIPDLSKINPIRPQDFVSDALTRSYELKTLNALLAASENLTQEVVFSFLDPEGSGAIGFATASSIYVSQSRENEIKVKTQQTGSLIEQRALQAANEYNSALDAYRVATDALSIGQKRLRWLIQRHRQGDGTLGEAEFVEQLADTQFKIMSFIADQASSVLGFEIAKSRVDRLTLNGYYQRLEDALPKEPKTDPGVSPEFQGKRR